MGIIQVVAVRLLDWVGILLHGPSAIHILVLRFSCQESDFKNGIIIEIDSHHRLNSSS